MRKLILLFFVVLLGVSCGNDWHDDYVPRMWYIYNSTEQTVIFKYPYHFESEGLSFNPILSENLEYRESEITSKSRLTICRGMIPIGIIPELNYYFAESAEAFGEDVSWQILSKDGVLLKIWEYSNRNSPNERFFKESEWRDTQSGLWPAFVFTITPEDIQHPEQ